MKVISLCDRRLTAPNISAQLNQWCEKNVSTSPVKRRLYEAGLYGRTVVKRPILRKEIQCQKAPVGQGAQRLGLWTDELKFKIFGSNRRVYVQQRVGERAAIPCITQTIKYRGDSVILWGLLPIVKLGICTR